MLVLPMETASGPVFDEDQALLQRYVRTGDRQSLAQLVVRHGPTLHRIARRFTGSDSDADDIVQEALLGIMRDARQVSGRGSVRSWMVGVTANRCRTWLRTVERRRRHEAAQVAASAATDSVREPGEPELARQLEQALAQLPERYRLPVSLRFLDGASVADIAATLQAKEATVRSWIERGLEKLRLRLGQTRADALLSAALALPVPGLSGSAQQALMQQALHAPLPSGASAFSAMHSVGVLGAIVAVVAVVATASVIMRIRPATVVVRQDGGGHDPAQRLESAPALAPALQQALGRTLPLVVRRDRASEVAWSLTDALRPDAQLRFGCFADPGDQVRSPTARLISLPAGDPTLQQVLDALRDQGGLRVRLSGRCITLDHAQDPAWLATLLDRSRHLPAQAGLQAMLQLLLCGDSDAVRQVVLALGQEPSAHQAAQAFDSRFNQEYQTMTLDELQVLDDPAIEAAILQALGSHDLLVRRQAVRLAGRLRMAAARAPLLALLAQEPPGTPAPDVATTAQAYPRPPPPWLDEIDDALGRIGGPGVAAALVPQLPMSDEAVAMIARVGDPSVLPQLRSETERSLAHLQGSFPSAHVQACLSSLALLGHQENEDLFLKVLGTSPAQPFSLASSVLPDAPLWADARAIPTLLPYLAPGVASMEAMFAITALARLPDPAVRAALLERVRSTTSDRQEYVARDCAGALCGTHDPRMRAALTALMPDDRLNPSLYAVLIEVLGAQGTPGGDDLIATHPPLGTDPGSWNAWSMAVARCRDAMSTRLLTAGLAADQPLVRRTAACRALPLNRDADLMQRLQALSRDRDPLMRAEVAGSLDSLQDPEAVPILLSMCHDADPVVRRAAERALPGCEGSEGPHLREVIEALNDPDLQLRSAAARLINTDDLVLSTQTQGRTSEQTERFESLASAVCAHLSQDPDPALRRLLLQQLSAFTASDQERFAPTLLAVALHDPDPVLRCSAVAHLDAFTMIDRSAILTQLQADLAFEREASVRAAIIRCVGAVAVAVGVGAPAPPAPKTSGTGPNF